MTCDPKHIFKRFATLLRAREGILIDKSVVNKNHLRSHLVRLPGTNPSTVEALVDPADKQNVPKAVTLIQSLNQLKTLNTSRYTPSQMNEHRSLVAVGEIFSSFMDPFITVTMSLSDQLTSLSKYAHAAFVVYSKHSTNFMTSALYADSQAVVKNEYFCVAKQKSLDPKANYYVFQDGSDRLEIDFCLARTQSHHRNFDILDLAGKLAMSSLIDCIYARNPTLDAGSRRLKVSGASGIDHLNPKSWIGDVNVDKVSLQLCWEAGREQAVALLSSIYPGDPAVDFSTIFRSADHDLLRPTGRYVGFSNEADFSIMEDPPDTETTPKLDLNVPHPAANVASDSEDDGDSEDDRGYGDDVDNEASGRDLEDLLPDSADEPIDGFNSSAKDWLEINGQRYLKTSLVSQHLKANRSKKVVERTLRVRGLTLDDLRKHPPKTSLDPSGDNFQVGDLVATLVRTGSFVCLVILQATGIRKDRRTQHVIEIEILHDPKEEYFVQGEVLRIVQVGPDWLWPLRDYLKVSKPKKSRHKGTTIRDFTLSVPGSLCYRVKPEVHHIPHQHSPRDPTPPVQESETWVFCANELEDLFQLAWSDLQPEDPQGLNDKIKSLPQVWGSESFPYTDDSGAAAFATEVLAPELPNTGLDKESKQCCPLCHEEKKLKELRGHIGLHILWCLLGVDERLEGGKVGNNPCGFCGSDQCNTDLVTARGKREVKSNCSLRCKFKYGAAQKSTKNSPCTNIPINCPHCSEIVWKYNAVNHIIFRHKDLLDSADLDPHFILEIQLGKDEEAMMGIPGDSVMEYHAKYPGLFPQGEDFIAVETKAQGTQKPTKRQRPRVESTSPNKKRRR